MGILWAILLWLRGRATLVAENLALRHQLAVLQRSIKQPRLRRRDRIFWSWLSCFWPRLAIGTGHCPTRDRRPLAPRGLPSLLALEVQKQEWQTRG
jgi:hypothetical protein